MKFFQLGFMTFSILLVLQNSINCADNSTTKAVSATTPTTQKPADTTKPKEPPKVTEAPAPKPKALQACPPQAELQAASCLCYPSMNYLICDGTQSTFSFSDRYEFASLVIKNSPHLPFWNEHLSKSSDFKVSRLVILQENPVEITDNFNELLRLPEKAIKIVANGQIQTVDISFLSKSLTSISINENITVNHNYFAHYYFEDLLSLSHLQFRNVRFNPAISDLFLQSLPLIDIEIVNSGLTGKFSFVPKVCPVDNNRLTINLNGNQLTDFNFTYLFPESNDTKDCRYHIELSDNPLRDDLLTTQLEILEKKAEKIFLVLRNVKLICDCKLYNLYQTKSSKYLHSVRCSNVDNLYLDQIPKGSDAEKKICPVPKPDPAPAVHNP